MGPGVPGGGGVHRISSDGNDRMGGKNQNLPKIPRASFNTPKIPGPKINPDWGITKPEKFPESIKPLSDITPPSPPKKNELLAQATSIKYLPNFPTKKIPELKLRNPRESHDHPRHLKFGVPPPPWAWG